MGEYTYWSAGGTIRRTLYTDPSNPYAFAQRVSIWYPDDFEQRFEGTLSADGTTIASSCYLVEDGAWIHDFDVTYTRFDEHGWG